MASKALTDSEAIRICRTPKPTPGAAKDVLQWGVTPPRPDKAAWLLLLQTDNYLSRKALAKGFTEALAACAASDTSPLWKTVEQDWDTYRVLHAIKAIAQLEDKRQTERLIGLGDTPILRIHWSAIKEAASRQGISIPEAITDAQSRLEAQRGNADFHARFLARKDAWPEASDLETPDPEKAPAKPAAAKAAKTKPDPASGPSGTPAFLDSDGEANPFLKSHKKALAGKWSLKAMQPLFDAVDLAFYLVALNRKAEAEEICDHLAGSVAFSGNFNVWTPVGYGICLKARLLRSAGKAGQADVSLQPILANPFNRPLPPEQIEKKLQAIPEALETAAAQSGKKAACQDIGRTLYTLCFHLELSSAKAPGYTEYAVGPLEALWKRGLETLENRLRT